MSVTKIYLNNIYLLSSCTIFFLFLKSIRKEMTMLINTEEYEFNQVSKAGHKG